jgi:hypothetical protein
MTKNAKLILAFCFVALATVAACTIWPAYSAKQRFEAVMAEQHVQRR